MDKKEIIEILHNYKKELKEEYGIVKIGIFGSMARGEDKGDSDVDVVLSISEPDLFMLAGIKNDLEEKFCRPVDIITYWDNMNPFLKKRIDGEAIYV